METHKRKKKCFRRFRKFCGTDKRLLYLLKFQIVIFRSRPTMKWIGASAGTAQRRVAAYFRRFFFVTLDFVVEVVPFI